MKRLSINGRSKKVFVLSETEHRIIYIPVSACHRVDYERLKKIEAKNPDNMLDELKETKLDNGRNALVVYDKLIQVANRQAGLQLDKYPSVEDNEKIRAVEAALKSGKTVEEAKEVAGIRKFVSDLTPSTISMKNLVANQEKEPPKRRGRPPKNAS
jgi:hypothetical protein